MKFQLVSGLWRPRGQMIGPVLLGLTLLLGCGGDAETSGQQGQALVPADGADANADSTALDAYDLDQELAAVQEQLGMSLEELQGVMAETQTEGADEAQVVAGSEADDALNAAQPTPAAETPAPATQAAAAPAPTATGVYGLQLGSFRDVSRADQLVARLRELGQRPVIETAEVSGQIWHRVCLWGLPDKAAAVRLGERLQSELKTEYLVRRKS